MATIIDPTLPHGGAISLIEDDAPAVANTWNDPFGELNDILAHLGGGQTVVVGHFADLAEHGPPVGGAVLAIVENDRTLWANWGTAPAGEGTAVGAGGTRWVRLNPIRPRSIFHQSQTALAEPSAPAQEIVLATVQARAGAYGAVDISFTMSDWGRTQDPDAQIRIFYNGESSSENILVVDVSDTVADGPLVLGATMSDYPSALVTVTVYATGVIALAGARRVLTVRTD